MASYGFPNNFTLGDLRWRVTLATRLQVPDPSGTGIIETFINPYDTWASIKPISLQTFIDGEQIDNGPTHKIITRFIDSLDWFDCVLRSIIRDDGTRRDELFRVFRISTIEGRLRFTSIDAILEKRDG